MPSINVAVVNPWLLMPFFGTAAACISMIVAARVRWHDARASYGLLRSMLYLVGAIATTLAFNVPRNRALAAVAPRSKEAMRLWVADLSTGTGWNHVRAAAALLAAPSFALGPRAAP